MGTIQPDRDLKPLVLARYRGGTVDEDLAARVLADAIKTTADTPTDEHGVGWSVDAWLSRSDWDGEARAHVEAIATTLPEVPEKDGRLWITRADVFDRREEADGLDLYLAAMAWGYGRVGYGAWRTAAVLRRNGSAGVRHTVAHLRSMALDPSSGYFRAWSAGGEAKLTGVGSAFASKLAYCAAYDRSSGTGPLIADVNTSWALWALTGIENSRVSSRRYEHYVAWAEEQAGGLRCRSDDIERALFTLGPVVRRLDSESAISN